MTTEKLICFDCGKPLRLKKNVYASSEENFIGVPYSIWKCSGCGLELIELTRILEVKNDA